MKDQHSILGHERCATVTPKCFAYHLEDPEWESHRYWETEIMVMLMMAKCAKYETEEVCLGDEPHPYDGSTLNR